MTALAVRESNLTTEVADLLKWNRELLKARRKDNVKVDTIQKEFGKVQKFLKEARLSWVNLESLDEKMDKLKDKAKGWRSKWVN